MTVLLVSPALANHGGCALSSFCDWNPSQFATHPPMDTNDGSPGAEILLPDNHRDKISSVRNRTNDVWCLVNLSFFGDSTVYVAPPGTFDGYVGNSANDKTDRLDIEAQQNDCT